MTDFLQSRHDLINDISPSFCAAKWLNATIWLGNGRTASCHHPNAHTIPPMELLADPSALHNTAFKKEQRKKMLDGERPTECNYCWQIEDIDTTVYSDRVYKSALYTEDEIEHIRNAGWDENIDPKTLEISFDNLCNLSCMYCNPEFSSTWGKDIKKNGPYDSLVTDGGYAFKNDGSHALAFDTKNKKNFYIESFFKWFDGGLKNNLQELRVTGGEPTRSPHFWELVDKCNDTKFDFAVNSNLIMDGDRLKRLTDCSKKFKSFDLYTSCEAPGTNAELIRHGFDYDQWLNNLNTFIDNASYRQIIIMMTINVVGVFTMTEFMDDIIELRKRLGKGVVKLSLNILRFPSFQSISIIPSDIRQALASNIDEWLSHNEEFLGYGEMDQCRRISTYLRNVDGSYDNISTIGDNTADFVKFLNEYCKRRSIDINTVMTSELFLKWWTEINE